MKKPNSLSRGFTLIELMVAMVIFAIGVTALIMTHAGIMQSNTRSAARSGAVVELENLMERSIAMSKMRYPNGCSGYDSLWTLGVGAVVVNDNVMGIQRRLEIDTLIGTRTTSGTITLTGTVSWTTGTRSDSINSRITLARHD